MKTSRLCTWTIGRPVSSAGGPDDGASAGSRGYVRASCLPWGGGLTLPQALITETVRLRLAIPRQSRSQLDEMDEQQAEWVRKADGRSGDGAQELGGRTSGPAEWRLARGEAGGASAARPRYTGASQLAPLSPYLMFSSADHPDARFTSAAFSDHLWHRTAQTVSTVDRWARPDQCHVRR